MTLRKDMEQLVKAAEAQGWTVQKTRGGHWKLYAPDGEHIVTAAGTPDTASSVRNTLARPKAIWFQVRRLIAHMHYYDVTVTIAEHGRDPDAAGDW